jgi:hypothetical protein
MFITIKAHNEKPETLNLFKGVFTNSENSTHLPHVAKYPC